MASRRALSWLAYRCTCCSGDNRYRVDFSFRSAAGYIGGLAWIVLLFLPAIGLRKMTELAAQARLQIGCKTRRQFFKSCIPAPSCAIRSDYFGIWNLRGKLEGGMVGMPLRNSSPLESSGRHSRCLRSRPIVRHSQLRSAPAVLTLILLNAVAFLFEISVGDLNDPEVLHRVGALEPYAVVVQGEYWRLFTALFLHGGFTHLLFNIFALYILGPPLERSIGTLRFTVCYLISGLASSAGVVGLTVLGFVQVVAARRRVGLYHGDRRHLGRVSSATSSRAAGKTTPGKHCNDHSDSSRIRSFDATSEHGGASVRTNRRFLSRAYPRATNRSRDWRPREKLRSKMFLATWHCLRRRRS